MKMIATESYEETSGGGATRPLPRDGGMEELHGDPTIRPCLKV